MTPTPSDQDLRRLLADRASRSSLTSESALLATAFMAPSPRRAGTRIALKLVLALIVMSVLVVGTLGPGGPLAAWLREVVTPEATLPNGSPILPNKSPIPSSTVGVSTFVGESFTFSYPANWAVLSGYEHYGLHGPTVLAAVGAGDFNLGCSVDSTSVTCQASPTWVLAPDGVVLAYRFGAWLGPIIPVPTETPGPGEQTVEIGGRMAFRTETSGSVRIRFPGAPEYIEARWGATSADAPTLIEAVLASWNWTSPPIR